MGSGSSAAKTEAPKPTSASTSTISSGYETDATPDHSRSTIMKRTPLLKRPSVAWYEKDREKKERTKAPALKNVFKGFEDVKKFLQSPDSRKARYFGKLDEMLQTNVVDVFGKFNKDQQRSVMANKLAEIEFVKVLVDCYVSIIAHLNIDCVTNSFVDEINSFDDNSPDDVLLKNGYIVIINIREILWNYSDSCHSISAQIAETEILQRLVNDLKNIYEDEFDDLQMEESGDNIFPFHSAVAILHNCSSNPNIDKARFRDINTVEVLTPFLKTESIFVKMVTLLALCNMVSEKEISKLTTDNDVINFLTKSITKAIASPDRQEHGFHLNELVDGLAAIAQSDENKQIIFTQTEVLDLVVQILQGSDVHEHEIQSSVKLIWELCFSDKYKDKIKEKRDLMKELVKLQKSDNKDIVRAVKSVDFLLVIKDEKLREDQGKSTSLDLLKAPPVGGSSGANISQPKRKHIMISYSWGDKEKVLPVYHRLNEDGFPIWIDIINMKDYMNVLDGMSQAVEEAFVVLLCFSEKYKNGQNTRTEADYLFARRIPFIPLKMERGYQPDGWLGMLIGARLYIEFSGHYSFENKFKELTELLVKYQSENEQEQLAIDQVQPKHPMDRQPKQPVEPKPQPDPTKQQSKQPPLQPIKEQSSLDQAVKTWTKDNVCKWMVEMKLEGNGFKKVRQLNGKHLLFLQKVMKQAPDTYFRYLETKLGIDSLDDLMMFDEAMQTLP